MSSVLDAGAAQAGGSADEPGTWEPTRAFLRSSIAFLLVGSAIFEALLFVQGQGSSTRALIVPTMAFLGLVGWFFLHRNRITLGLMVLGVGVWGYLVVASVFMGGVNSLSMMIFPVHVLLAGWLCGPRTAMRLAILTAAITLAMAIGEGQGWLPHPPPTSPLLRWFASALVYVFAAILVSSVFSSYAQRMADVKSLGHALARRTAELESREADLNRAQAVASIGSWTYDLESDRMQLSAETCRIFGLAAGTEGSHDTYLSFVHDDERDAVIAAWDTALAGGASFDHEHRIVTGDGERWVRQQAELQRDASGRVLRAVGTTQDVTERKQDTAAMQAARDQLAATLDAIPDLLFEVDLEGRYLDYHSPNAELLAAPQDHLIGRTVSEVLPASVAGVCLAAIQEAHATGRSHGRSFELDLPQGRTWFELSIARKPVQVGDLPRFIVISRDITKRKRAEAEIMAFNATLEARVRERTVELEKANRELESFSYTISHDLRAPLRSMVGFSGMLVEDLGDKLDHDSRDLLRRISTSGTRMSRLIDGVLEYSRLAKSEIVRRDVNLDALVGEVVTEARERNPRVEVVIGSLGTALADPVMVRQIFHNLIENAFKFSAGTATPRVEIGSESTDGFRWYFVRDNGMGFDMQHAEHLFSLFTRLHNDPEIDSTGAGLAIVKRLVERHGGAVLAEAAPGQGATFRFHL